LLDDALNERYAQHDEDRKQATTAIKSRIPEITRFIGENLEMPHYFGGEEVLEIIDIKVVGVDDVRTPITQTPGEPSAVSAQVSSDSRGFQRHYAIATASRLRCRYRFTNAKLAHSR